MESNGRTCLPMGTFGVIFLLWGLATTLPLVLWRWNPPFVDSTYGGGHQPFELLGMSLVLLTLGLMWWILRDRDHQDPKVWLLGVLWILPVLFATQYVAEHAQPSWDWKCYVGAADALRD